MKRDLKFSEYTNEFVDSIMKLSKGNCSFWMQYTITRSLARMIGVYPRNSETMEIVPMSGTYPKLNIHSTEHY
jgi:hypothetical protein